MATSFYQLGIMGEPEGLEVLLFRQLGDRLSELGLKPETLRVLEEAEIESREKTLPFIAVFFGYKKTNKTKKHDFLSLKEDSVVIIPCVEDLQNFSDYIPEEISHINGLALNHEGRNIEVLASLILENFRLLRQERRLFISYKRSEAQSVAIQLYEALDALGFDVFIDTRSVRPSSDFQETLWHRMADSDVIVLLDTPHFRESHWTQMELANANDTNVQILHLLWPTVDEDKESALSNFLPLATSDFQSTSVTGTEALLGTDIIESICKSVESLRARAFAARHYNLIDNFCDQMSDIKIETAVQAERYISLRTPKGDSIAVVPAIGVPSATNFQDIEEAIDDKERYKTIWLLYDERGIRNRWLTHIDWLNLHLPLQAVRVSQADEFVREQVK